MMKELKYFATISSLLLGLLIQPIVAQTPLNLSDKSTMTVSGTSTLHDWHSEVETIKASAEAKIEGGQLVSIEKLIINVPVTSIKSGKSAMDKNTFEALKYKEHPTLKYQLTSSKIQGNQITAEGKMVIAGEVRSVTLTGSYLLTGNSITIEGNYDIDMNDYNIEPPTALMGTVTTGKDVTIHYHIIFNY